MLWSILLDVALIALIVIPIGMGIHNGFVKTVVRFAGFFISLLVAFIGSRFLASLLSGMLRNTMIDYTTQKIGESVGGDLTAAIVQFQESVPSLLQNWISWMGTPEQIAQKISSTTEQTAVNAATGITDAVILPLVTTLFQIILFLILLTLCGFLVKYIARAMGIVNRIPVIGTLNGIAGGIFGLLEGILIVFIILSIGGFILSLIPTGQEILHQTVLFEFLSGLNPFQMG
jgi:uncharacterized membrane protein required for colicin V production